MLINVKIPTMSRIKYLFSCVEHEKSFITSRPDVVPFRMLCHQSPLCFINGSYNFHFCIFVIVSQYEQMHVIVKLTYKVKVLRNTPEFKQLLRQNTEKAKRIKGA